MKKTTLLKSASILAAAVVCSQATAHGWVEFPSARQNTCDQDGGYWTNSIPNEACQQAFDKSGAYPFTQKNEVSINVQNYQNIDTVKAAIQNGLLCSAGTEAKAGLNIPSEHWQKTAIKLDDNNQFELVFHATAQHNPSFWEFYLTKEDYDPSVALTWDDLELVDTKANTKAGDDSKYRLTVTLPSDRDGDAILYTRWQRDDAAGEGFYNCSDITLSNSGGTAPDPDQLDPSEPEGNYLNDIGRYITHGFGPTEVGDTVRFRTFDKSGSETNDIMLEINHANLDTWEAVLAAKFNQKNEGSWFIGIWHQSMEHYMFDTDNVHANRVFSSLTNTSYQLSLIKEVDQLPPVIDPDMPVSNQYIVGTFYKGGDVVFNKGASYQCISDVVSGWCSSEAAWAYEPGVGSSWQQAWNEVDSNLNPTDPINPINPIDPTDPTDPINPIDPTDPINPIDSSWQSDDTYNAGDKVSFNGQVWTAQWWTKNEEPGTTGKWGVWR